MTKFSLDLAGGKRGLLENGAVEDICSVPELATVRMTGQNGARKGGRVTIDLPCDRAGSTGTGTESRGHRRAVTHR